MKTFVLTRRDYVEGLVHSLLNEELNLFYTESDLYGMDTRVDDLIYQSEMCWEALFQDDQEVTYVL